MALTGLVAGCHGRRGDERSELDLALAAADRLYEQRADEEKLREALDAYLASLADGVLPLGRAYALDLEERMVRELVLGLKLGRVDLRHLRRRFAIDPLQLLAEPLEEMEAAGWLRISAGRNELELTRDGLLRVDRLIPGLYLPRHRGLRYS